VLKLWESAGGSTTDSGTTDGGSASAPVEEPTGSTGGSTDDSSNDSTSGGSTGGSTGTTGLHLTGTSASQTLTGGAGDDTIDGGGGADRLIGGAGDDHYITNGASTVVEVSGGGVDTVQSTSSFTLNVNVEDLELIGTRSYNGQGNALDNHILGSSISNSLTGRDGDDTLNGAGGHDSVHGGRGDDVLIGGTGAERFIFMRGDGDDRIKDFGLNGEHDMLDISSLLKAGLRPTLTDSASGVTVGFSNGDSIFLEGTHLANMHATTVGYVF
jgi:Ca2+-binding RTX toxin-like protein